MRPHGAGLKSWVFWGTMRVRNDRNCRLATLAAERWSLEPKRVVFSTPGSWVATSHSDAVFGMVSKGIAERLFQRIIGLGECTMKRRRMVDEGSRRREAVYTDTRTGYQRESYLWFIQYVSLDSSLFRPHSIESSGPLIVLRVTQWAAGYVGPS